MRDNTLNTDKTNDRTSKFLDTSKPLYSKLTRSSAPANKPSPAKKSASASSQKNAKPQKTEVGAHRSAPSGKKTAKPNSKSSPKRGGGAKSAPAGEKAKNSAKNGAQQKKFFKNPLKIIPLGGLDEIGKNCTVFEYENEIIIIDCGMSFPDSDMPGVDIVIPDVSYLVKNKDKIKGLFITHGHEDHIGSIPYLMREINVPIYATKLTCGLIKGKLTEHGLVSKVKLIEKKPGDIVTLGRFSVEFIHVNHSIPDAVGFAIKTPVGTVIHTGDFKIDSTPISDGMIDLARIAALGNEGVLALLSDSTNAERAGFTMSERTVGESFSQLFKRAERNRILVATFSSNIHRIQQIVDEAVKCGRKVAVSGRSMINVVNIATELGYLNIPSGVLIDIDTIKRYTPEQLVIVTTGSQGEPMSALHRMAHGDHRQVQITPNDTIIISASPIPGNEKTVSNVVNELIKLGAHVIYEKMYDVHVSGHACQEEQKLIMALAKPKFFIPVHGEQKHLRRHADSAQAVGIDKKNILIGANGKTIELTPDSIKFGATVQSGRVLVDGLGVGDVGSIVLRDRKHLAEDGIIIAVMSVDAVSGDIISGPDLVSRGFVYVRESENLMRDAEAVIVNAYDSALAHNADDRAAVKGRVRDALSKFMYERTMRSPMILPIIMEV
ncbi:MAG: RNase J family beta-CASP ribonuclease [Acutalibacteraceae bacterium]